MSAKMLADDIHIREHMHDACCHEQLQAQDRSHLRSHTQRVMQDTSKHAQ